MRAIMQLYLWFSNPTRVGVTLDLPWGHTCPRIAGCTRQPGNVTTLGRRCVWVLCCPTADITTFMTDNTYVSNKLYPHRHVRIKDSTFCMSID